METKTRISIARSKEIENEFLSKMNKHYTLVYTTYDDIFSDRIYTDSEDIIESLTESILRDERCNHLHPTIACAYSDNLDIKQSYEYKVTHLPVPKKLMVNETAEIRCQLERSGEYTNTKYYLRFYQPDGKGKLNRPHA